ncbi:MAG: enoyl-CoA hydratase-related protein [Bacteroidota bacterium]
MDLSIITSIKGRIATITLNRPATRNAFDIEMIRELTSAIDRYNADSGVRILIFRGNGDHFSAGADLNWMKDGMKLPNEKLLAESLELAELFRKIYESPHVTVALVNGNVLGGANGIVAACDFCLAAEEARFGLTEVRLGLLPATISPYIIRKTGLARARELMLTGRVIGAGEARQAGLVSQVCHSAELEAQLGELTRTLLNNGPEALRGVKSLLRSIEDREIDQTLSAGTAEVIARYRMSSEGQEGINAFLEKRKPDWTANEQEEL